MKIIRLSAENVKRLKAVEIEPDGNVVVISGRNAQGKSSLLDAIFLALAGGDAAKTVPRPIRDGEDHAHVTLDLGDMTVTREWAENKPTKLTVRMANGRIQSSPQKMLDELVGKLSFDPLAFTRLSPKEQRQQLLDLIGLDFRQADIDRQKLYDERLQIGRDRDSYGDLGEISTWDKVPEVEVSSSDIIARIRASQEADDAKNRALSEVDSSSRRLLFAEERIESLREQLEEAERRLLSEKENNRQLVLEAFALQHGEDISALQSELEAMEETNTRVRERRDWLRKKATQDELDGEYKGKTREIDAIDESKRQALLRAQMPVPGVGFDDHGVTYQGVPFEQSSSAEQIKVSLGMAMAANPTLRVIRIMDGSLLDEDSMRAIAEMATDSDYQLWVETVGDKGESAIIIEDGSVVS